MTAFLWSTGAPGVKADGDDSNFHVVKQRRVTQTKFTFIRYSKKRHDFVLLSTHIFTKTSDAINNSGRE